MTQLTKHRFMGVIAKEINELKEIAGCYNHFLSSYEASQMPVTKAQIQLNKILIWKEINRLQEEYDNAIIETRIEMKEPRMKFETYKTTPLEDAAIIAFNSDKRFTITE